MRKVSEIIGLPVLALDTGRKVEDVDDVLFEPEQNRILALLVDRGGWFDGAKVVRFSAVQSIGDDAVVVPSERSITPVKAHPDIKRALDSHRVVSGMKVYSMGGDYLGRVSDMVVDEATGEVKGYEVTGGFVQETLRGKKFVPAPETTEVGQEVVFVPTETGERMEREVTGGIQKTAETTSEQMREMTERARAGGEEALGRAREQISEAGARGGETLERARVRGEEALVEARESVLRASAEQQKRFVIGKTVESAVTTPDGNVIARPGEVVTPSVADEAERRGVLTDLVRALAVTEARGTSARIGGEAGGTMGRLREEAAEAVSDVRRTIEEWTGRAQARSEQERIQDALGRPVTRVILDSNDQVILNTGEIVTHRAIERARTAGVLDILLDSVDKSEPRFGVGEKRAPYPGEAGLSDRERDR